VRHAVNQAAGRLEQEAGFRRLRDRTLKALDSLIQA